jgi:hypothetical protein
MRIRAAGLVALLLVLSSCTGLGNSDQTKACLALADQVPGISGVKEASFTDSIVSSLPRCAGVVVLDPSLTAAQRGQIVGSVYNVVRARGVKEVEFTTQFTQGASTFAVTAGFPTDDQATGVLVIADKVLADTSEIGWSLATGLVAVVHARLTATSPAASLREGTGLLQLTPPTGISKIDWYLNEPQIVAPTIASDEATHLEAVASWFEKNPGVTSYTLTVDEGVQTWTLTTTTETPDAVRAFAAIPAGSGVTVKVSASLAGKAPYITLP